MLPVDQQNFPRRCNCRARFCSERARYNDPMRLRNVLLSAVGGTLLLGVIYAQLPFREYPGVEYDDFPLPPDYREKTEWVFARLMYPPSTMGYRGYGGFGGYGGFRGRRRWGGDWTQGSSSWTTD